MTVIDREVAFHDRVGTPGGTVGGPFRRASEVMILLATFTVGWQDAVKLPGPPLAKAVGLLAGLLGLLALLVEGRRPRLRDAHYLAIVVVVVVALSSFWTIDQARTLSTLGAAVLLTGLLILSGEFQPGRPGAVRLATAYCAGTLVSAGLLVFRHATGTATVVYGRERVGSLHPNDFAFMLCLAIPLAWYVGARRGRGWLVAAYVYVPLALFAIVLSASRAGLILGLLAATVVPWTTLAGRPRRAAVVGLILLAVGPLAVPLLPAQQVSRLSTTSSELRSGDLNNRAILWSTAWAIIGDKPLTGVGAGASRVAIEKRSGILLGAHNTFLSVGAELGMLGLTCFALLLFSLAGPVVRMPPSLDRRTLVVLGLVVLVGLQVRHWEYEKALWAIFAFFVAASDPDNRDSQDRQDNQDNQAAEVPS